jgi:hypothetical protein
MAAVRRGHGRCADLESRLLSGERWIYVDQQSLLKAEVRRFDPPRLPLTTQSHQ